MLYTTSNPQNGTFRFEGVHQGNVFLMERQRGGTADAALSVSIQRQRKEKIMIYRFRLSLFLLAGLLATTPAFAQELSGTLKKVKESGTIVMGIRESSYPLSYLDDKQQPIGYHLEICNKIVDAEKKELKIANLKVQHQPVTSPNRHHLVH